MAMAMQSRQNVDFLRKKGAPSYETKLHTIDSASCRGVRSDQLLLE